MMNQRLLHLLRPKLQLGGSVLDKPTHYWRSRSVRLGVLFAVLAALLGVSGYLLWRHGANKRHQIAPPDGPPLESALDPEVAARPGVAALRKLGGRIEIDDALSGKPITKVFLTSAKVTDSELTLLKPWTSLRVLDLSGTKISDAGLRNLEGLAALETLFLSFTPIRGEGLQSVAKLSRLHLLDLSKTQVAEQALENLKGLQSLEVLSLIDVPVTDDGLKHLAGLTGLRRLDLTGTQITDAGLVHLKGLTRLEHLNLYGAYVTKAGVDRLSKDIPGVRVSTSD